MYASDEIEVSDLEPEVLLLDDDPLALDELEEIVDLEGWIAHTATSIEDAMELLEENPYINVVVTDVHIKSARGMASGVAFVEDARKRFSQRDLSFIVLSGDASAVTASLKTGAVDFLTKPLIPEDLIAAICAANDVAGDEVKEADLENALMRQVAQKTEALQRVSEDLASREREISATREGMERRRLNTGRLRHAMSAGHIIPWFQPQVCARTGRILGYEALVRWIDPATGMQSPADFLPMVEEAGLMNELDMSIQRQSFKALKRFHAGVTADCVIGVNITAEQLRRPDMVDRMLLEIDEAGLQPGCVAIEVLESAMLDDVMAIPIKRNIERLSQVGCKIELDDFGTGHSGFSSLRDLPVNRVKIDRSFVQDVHQNSKLQQFTRALIGLAKTLGIEVLAEGVETDDEIAWLRAEGCDAMQGFQIARPMPAFDAHNWSKKWVGGQAALFARAS